MMILQENRITGIKVIIEKIVKKVFYMNKKKMILSSIERLKKSGFDKIQAAISGYEKPQAINKSYRNYVPEVVATYNLGTYIFEMVPDTEINKDLVRDRWKTFSEYVSSKNGKLYLVVLEGRKELLKKLIMDLRLKGTGILQLIY